MVRVHRLSFAVSIGVTLETLDAFCDDHGQPLTVDHLCKVPPCFNPSHLELVAIRTNVLRGATVTAANVPKVRCLEGHRLVAGNLVPSGLADGERRQCLACSRIKGRVRAAARRGALVDIRAVEAAVFAKYPRMATAAVGVGLAA
jgi:hypothetical protein